MTPDELRTLWLRPELRWHLLVALRDAMERAHRRTLRTYHRGEDGRYAPASEASVSGA